MLLKADKNKMAKSVICAIANCISRLLPKPRLNVFRSPSHIYVQIIDDVKGVTLTAASSMDKGLTAVQKQQRVMEVGAAIAKKALAAGITEVIFESVNNSYDEELFCLLEAVSLTGLKF